MNSHKVNVFKHLDESLLKKWQKLWDESELSHFYNSPKWFGVVCKSFDVKEYLIIAVENNDQIEAIFPLIYEKRFGINTYCNPGGKFADKSPLLLKTRDQELIKHIVEKLTTLGNLYLEELSSDVAEMMVSYDKSLLKQKASISPYLSLKSDPFENMSSKNRGKMINRVKNNEKDLSYKHFLGDPESLEIVFKVDEHSYKRQKGMSGLVKKKEREFYKSLLKENGKNFVVDVVYFKNNPFIYSIGFLHKKTFYAGITSYDKDYAYLSPGKILQYYLLNQLQKDKIEVFDFSRGQNSFKKDFTNLANIQYNILYSKNPLTIICWQIANKIYNGILESKLLYGTYLFFKKASL